MWAHEDFNFTFTMHIQWHHMKCVQMLISCRRNLSARNLENFLKETQALLIWIALFQSEQFNTVFTNTLKAALPKDNSELQYSYDRQANMFVVAFWESKLRVSIKHQTPYILKKI